MHASHAAQGREAGLLGLAESLQSSSKPSARTQQPALCWMDRPFINKAGILPSCSTQVLQGLSTNERLVAGAGLARSMQSSSRLARIGGSGCRCAMQPAVGIYIHIYVLVKAHIHKKTCSPAHVHAYASRSGATARRTSIHACCTRAIHAQASNQAIDAHHPAARSWHRDIAHMPSNRRLSAVCKERARHMQGRGVPATHARKTERKHLQCTTE